MVNRAVLGKLNGSVFGLKISKPGFNVLTAATEDLLLDTEHNNTQVIQNGASSSGASSITVTHSNLGYNPVVIISCDSHVVYLKYLSNTQFRLHRGPSLSSQSIIGDQPMRYFVTGLEFV